MVRKSQPLSGMNMQVPVDHAPPRSGRSLAYVVMVWGGFMGRGERQLILPWTALHFHPEARAYVLNADEHCLHGAPCIDEHACWPAARTMAWHRWVHRHYEAPPYWHGEPVSRPGPTRDHAVR